MLGNHPGLELDVVVDKLVRRRRGRYCYEHALLFAAVLERLGLAVQGRMARVLPQRSGPRTHMMLAMRADGAEYLADVGFGAGLLRPMPLRDGAQADQAGWAHRLTRDEAQWALWKHGDQGWEILHAFDETPQRTAGVLPVEVEPSADDAERETEARARCGPQDCGRSRPGGRRR